MKYVEASTNCVGKHAPACLRGGVDYMSVYARRAGSACVINGMIMLPSIRACASKGAESYAQAVALRIMVVHHGARPSGTVPQTMQECGRAGRTGHVTRYEEALHDMPSFQGVFPPGSNKLDTSSAVAIAESSLREDEFAHLSMTAPHQHRYQRRKWCACAWPRGGHPPPRQRVSSHALKVVEAMGWHQARRDGPPPSMWTPRCPGLNHGCPRSSGESSALGRCSSAHPMRNSFRRPGSVR